MAHYRLIPVHRKGTVVAWTKVSEEDYARLSEHEWALGANGYITRATGRAWRVSMHRDVLGLEREDRRVADHINGDPLDNRRCNLRSCTVAENGQNVRKRPGVSSRFRGVTWHKGVGRWQASATVGGRYHHLGLFDDEEEAGAVAAAYRARHMPFSTDALGVTL